MKFTVTIKDNDTGAVIHESKCDAFIGGANEGDSSAVIAVTHCTNAKLINTCKAAIDAVSRTAESDKITTAIIGGIMLEKLEKMRCAWRED